MAAELCAGAASVAVAEGCSPIAGGQAVYFGADQPRITAEARIPWSALGVSESAAGAKLRVEIAVTAWDRDRWMSLSGRAPGAALADPALWRTMRLGNSPQTIEGWPILARAPD